MSRINWRNATRKQLCMIAYDDKEVVLEHKLAAAAELKRRARRRYECMNNKEKAVYPR